MRETFRYNSALLPEYVSTVVISLLTTWIVVSASTDQPLPTRGNPHFVPSVVMYCFLGVLLLGRTVHYRWKWCTISVDESTIRGSLFGVEKFGISFSNMESLKEEIGRFFGRRSRRLIIRSYRHEPVVISDFIFDYERITQLVGERTGLTIEQDEELGDERERLSAKSRQRDQVFGRPGPFSFLLRVPERAFCLLPVLLAGLRLATKINPLRC